MHYVMRLSGGLSSAVAAERTIRRYGRRNVSLVFADTAWEDEDLYRFLGDLMKRWGGKLITHRDGRTPLQVAEDHGIIPHAGLAPCTYDLKIKPFEDLMWRWPKPVTCLLGYDWRELHRVEKVTHYHRVMGKVRPPFGLARRVSGLYEDFPLLWKPYETRPYVQVCREDWGIEPPRLYVLGFPHNNCGGRCVRQGNREWLRLRTVMPERFTEMAEWEQAQMAKGGARADRTICSDRTGGDRVPVTLYQLAERADASLGMRRLFEEDTTPCVCGV